MIRKNLFENIQVTFWLAYRLLRSHGTRLFTFTGWIAFGGLVLGVACLFVSMAVISGFEETLKNSIADVVGHVQVTGVGLNYEPLDKITKEIIKIESSLVGIARFTLIEGVLAHQGRLTGVGIQGVDLKEISQVLGLQKRIVQGRFYLGKTDGVIQALIGKGVASKFNLKVDDEFKLVVPLASDMDPTQFRRKVRSLKVAGVLDLGKYEYDSRTVVLDLESSQELAEIGNRYSGLLLKFKDINRAPDIGSKLSRNLGAGFHIRDWKDVNGNLFEAVKYEKVIIFFVIMVIMLAAAFNVASALYINVIKRYPDIGILKSCGLSKGRVVQLFSFQGLLIGAIGLLGGLLFGSALCVLFTWAESSFGLIPGSIYKVDKIDLSIRFWDLIAIAFSTLMICYVATLAPAFKGARLTPVEGLRND